MAKEVKEKEAYELSEFEAVKKEIAQLLEKAKAEAAQIIASARSQTQAAPSAPIVDQAEKARGEELVETFLFKDSGKYSDDVFVSVNGENCLIKRGVQVKVKRKFYEVLMNSQAQDTLAANRAQQLSDRFAEKTRQLGE